MMENQARHYQIILKAFSKNAYFFNYSCNYILMYLATCIYILKLDRHILADSPVQTGYGNKTGRGTKKHQMQTIYLFKFSMK